MQSSRKSLGIYRGVCGSSRKSLGICRGVCGSSASLAAFAVGFAQAAWGFAAQGFALGFYRPGGSPLAMIRRPYRALPCTRPGCRPGGP